MTLPESIAPLRSLELFTGAGGLAIGTHLAGFQHAALAEWNQDACATLRSNVEAEAIPGIRNWCVVQGDVRALDLAGFGDIGLVAGGPPCQPFSIGGKHRGWFDERDMIPQFVRAIRELAPGAFIMENVRGLLRQTFRTYFNYVLLQLTYPPIDRYPDESWLDHLDRLEDIHTRGGYDDLRYNVIFRLINAADYGIPQMRERVFLVGFRADTGIEWHFPEPTHSVDALIHEQWVTGSYWERNGMARPESFPEWYSPRVYRPRFVDVTRTRPWKTVRDAISDLPPPRQNQDTAGILNHRLIPGARPYKGHTGSPLDLPAKTLKAGDHGVPGGENMIAFEDGRVRYFTVREAARLQTFADSWRFEGAWSEAMRQLGNAVPVELAHVLAKSVAQALAPSHD